MQRCALKGINTLKGINFSFREGDVPLWLYDHDK